MNTAKYCIPVLPKFNENIRMVCTQSKRILIIEEEPVFLRSLIFTLKRYHHYVRGFSNCSHLLEEIISAGNNMPELIIADMPVLSSRGFDLIDKIRNAGSSTPVLAIISFNDRHVIEGLKKRGITNFLIKPFSLVDFINQVESCLILCDNTTSDQISFSV